MGLPKVHLVNSSNVHRVLSHGSKTTTDQPSQLDSTQETDSANTGAAKALPFGGHYFMGCFEDNSPKKARLEYDALVPKKDRKQMSASVCFEFCRAKPNVEFFALQKGSKCYCSQYFTRRTSTWRDEQCDEPCKGGVGEMCGGKHKISAYEMHRE